MWFLELSIAIVMSKRLYPLFFYGPWNDNLFLSCYCKGLLICWFMKSKYLFNHEGFGTALTGRIWYLALIFCYCIFFQKKINYCPFFLPEISSWACPSVHEIFTLLLFRYDEQMIQNADWKLFIYIHSNWWYILLLVYYEILVQRLFCVSDFLK